ncbi:MAG: alpha-amylase/4-alpha-glucanotransferase domain-containing protein, partial [Planctomycetota bacterium]
MENQDWLHTQTLAQAVSKTASVGKIYLPDCSYREMTEWALPTQQQLTLHDLIHRGDDHPDFAAAKPFLRGGFWRNFKVKYEEANEMYCRMLSISQRVNEAAAASNLDPETLAEIRDHLYRGQCNCPYWHGAFGGIYLPHLRNAIFSHLIQAENRLETAHRGADAKWVEGSADDWNHDGMQEVTLSTDQYCMIAAPARGGRLLQWDLRETAHNLLATMQRRSEPYHEKVRKGPSDDAGEVASIHDRVVFKQEGLDQCLQVDAFPRKTLMDRFYDEDVTLQQVADGTAAERGDFVDMPYQAKLRRATDKVQLQMHRDGNAWGIDLSITKAITVSAGSNEVNITYLLENLPAERPFHFGIEMNFAGLPDGADDRFFSDPAGQRLGQLGQRLDRQAARGISWTDQGMGVHVT